MEGPYRALPTLEPEPLPSACVADPRGPDARCPAASPRACLFDLTRARRALPPLAARALAAAATLLLLVGAASIAALTYTVVSAGARLGAAAALRRSPPESAAIAALVTQRVSLPPLASLGPETREVSALWMRAERLAAAGFDVRTARALLPAGAIAASSADRARVEPDPRGGVRLAEIDPRSLAAQAGFARGDRVIAVNGLALRDPRDLAGAWDRVVDARAAVIEIEREGRPFVLRVDERW